MNNPLVFIDPFRIMYPFWVICYLLWKASIGMK